MALQEPWHQVTLLCFLGTLLAYVEHLRCFCLHRLSTHSKAKRAPARQHLTGPCMALQEPRHQVTLLCFLGTLVAYVERVGFSIAFTEMAKQAGTSEAVKGAVLSAFYWGYSLSQVRPLSPGILVACAYLS